MARPSFNFAPRSILCMLDFSAQSATALRHAAAIAKRSRGLITVMAVEDPRLVTAEVSVNDPRMLRKLRSFVRRSLPRGTNKSIQYLVALGKPAQEILKTAGRLRSGLVVVGTEGLGGTGKAFSGSTTEQLLRRAHVPVLAVPKPSRGPGTKTAAREWPGKWLIAPTHLESTAEAEAAQAAAVARAFGTSLILVHVMPTLRRSSLVRADLGTHYRTAIALAEEWLHELRPTVGNGVTTKSYVAVGNPGEEIAALAKERGIGLVVLTLRKRGKLLGSKAGTIAHHLLSHGVAPVLALPRPGVSVSVREKPR